MDGAAGVEDREWLGSTPRQSPTVPCDTGPAVYERAELEHCGAVFDYDLVHFQVRLLGMAMSSMSFGSLNPKPYSLSPALKAH